MALESLGEITANRIDLAFRLLHDAMKDGSINDFNTGSIGEKGVWQIFPSHLDGKLALEIRIVVG